MNTTIVNMSGKCHTAQAGLTNVQNAVVPIFTGTLLTKEAEELIFPGVEGDCAFMEHKENPRYARIDLNYIIL